MLMGWKNIHEVPGARLRPHKEQEERSCCFLFFREKGVAFVREKKDFPAYCPERHEFRRKCLCNLENDDGTDGALSMRQCR